MRKYYKRNPKSKLSKWDKKKIDADQEDFSMMRLVVGGKSSLVIILALKYGFVLSIILSIILLFVKSQIYKTIVIITWGIPILALVLMIVLSIIGIAYNHIGNSVDKVKKTFKKKSKK